MYIHVHIIYSYTYKSERRGRLDCPTESDSRVGRIGTVVAASSGTCAFRFHSKVPVTSAFLVVTGVGTEYVGFTDTRIKKVFRNDFETPRHPTTARSR